MKLFHKTTEELYDLGTHLAPVYAQAKPFAHIRLSGLCRDEVLDEVVREALVIPLARYNISKNPAQHGKRWINTVELLGKTTRAVHRVFNSPKFCRFLSILTGIEGLEGDPLHNQGGILHRTVPGGALQIHCDFNIHPITNLHRRLNALLFLNRDWQEEWGGALELWEQDMSRKALAYLPLFNDMVIFSTTDTSFHGHPHPLASPEGRDRLSLAFYYYSIDRPAHEKSPRHWAKWHWPSGITQPEPGSRQGQSDPGALSA